MVKEPWDSSSTKAKTLKMADFGMPQDIINMAAMPTLAKTKDEARLLYGNNSGQRNHDKQK
ncbi:MAG: hypothetical protein LBK63_08730 [Treponema sp.]|nr:hypothetical protein [Treponema sp.]